MTDLLADPNAEFDTFRAVVEGAPAMLWMGDEAGRCVFLNRAQRLFWGVNLGDLSNFNWNDTVHPADVEKLAGPFSMGMRDRQDFECEARYLRYDGAYRILRTSARPRFSREGIFLGMIGCNADVTETRDLEEGLSLLNQELTHRIKNIFSVVQGLMAVSGRAHPEAVGAMRDLRGRISAMASAYDMVRPTMTGDGDERSGTLRDLFDRLFAPYQDPASPAIKISGADPPVGPRAATTLALILHEQVTNALKHGALSAEGGEVHLEVSVDTAGIILDWREAGGPAVDGAPQGSGFGSVLLRTSIAGLGAEANADWRSDGLNWRLRLPPKSLER
jgi:PAS domain S-box-containing protein